MKPMLQRALLIATLFATQALAADMAHNAGTNAALSPVIAPESRQLLEMPAAAKNTMRFEMLERLKALQVVMQALAEGKPQESHHWHGRHDASQQARA
jgi:hypothetical protein